MADLAKALNGMFSAGDMTVFQATVDEIGTGVLTVHYNGGTFEDVPYLEGGFPGGPSIGDVCYVLGRENWGALVLGRPAPGPFRSAGDIQTILWEPFTRSRRNANGTWTAPALDEMTVAGSAAAVYFFDLADADWSGDQLATASFYLQTGNVDTGGEGVDNTYVTVGLHSTASPGGLFTEMTNLSSSYVISASDESSLYVPIPLDWANRMLSGEARGLYVRTEDFPLTVSGPGTLRLTTL